jgi:hypothetical protein
MKPWPLKCGVILLVALPVTLLAGRAAGNGAFPDSQAVLTPVERPHQILLATNFGLIASDDDGRRWTWSCEQDPRGTRNLYQLGPAPGLRLFARDAGGLVFTDDGGCRWITATSSFDGAVISDAFPDPTNDQRVLAVAAPRGGAAGRYLVLESSDGGATFTETRYTAAADDAVSGVEIARADPAVAYLVLLGGTNLEPRLARTTDRGASWQERDLTAALGTGSVLLVAVDAADPTKVFLQVNRATANLLAVVEGGGTTVTTPLTLDGGFMTAFLQTDDGVILVSGLIGADAVLYRSRDGARTFEAVPAPPRLWGLSQRAGTIFGAARAGESFALATSIDEGTTWQPLMRYADVEAIAACVQVQCQDPCLLQASRSLWSQEICAPAQPADGAAADGLPHDASGDGAADAGPPRQSGAGCGCRLTLTRRSAPLTAALLAGVALALVLLTARQSKRPGPY